MLRRWNVISKAQKRSEREEPCEQNEVNEAISCYVCQSSRRQCDFQCEIEG